VAQSLFAVLIHGGVFLLWIGSFARAFVLRGLVAWSVGIWFAGFLQTQYWNRDIDGQSALRRARALDDAGQGDRHGAADLRADRLRAI